MLDPERMEEILRELQSAKAELETDLSALRGEMRTSFGDINDSLLKLNATTTDILLEIGGVPDARFREPDRKTIRTRLHVIEDRQSLQASIAEKIISDMRDEQEDRAALKTVVTDLQRISVEAERRQHESKQRWSRRRVMFITFCTGIATTAALVGMIFSILTHTTG